MPSKWYAAIAAFFTGIILSVASYWKGRKDQNTETELHEKEVEYASYVEVQKAEKEGEEKTDENIKKTESGDWDGFNR